MPTSGESSDDQLWLAAFDRELDNDVLADERRELESAFWKSCFEVERILKLGSTDGYTVHSTYLEFGVTRHILLQRFTDSDVPGYEIIINDEHIANSGDSQIAIWEFWFLPGPRRVAFGYSTSALARDAAEWSRPHGPIIEHDEGQGFFLDESDDYFIGPEQTIDTLPIGPTDQLRQQVEAVQAILSGLDNVSRDFPPD